MHRKIKIIMDYDRKIKPDGERNWVTNGRFLEDDICDMYYSNRDILVIQPSAAI